jgi:ribosome maturation factor RimP
MRLEKGITAHVFTGVNAMPAPIEQEQIEKSVRAFLEHEGYEFVDLRITGSISHPMFEVYADIEGGITAADCGKLTRALQYRLTAAGLMDDRASLLVSSPGLDRVLKSERDFARFAGKEVNVWLVEKIGGRGKLRGILKGQENGTVLISGTEEGDIALSPGRWKEIRLVPEYPKGFK